MDDLIPGFGVPVWALMLLVIASTLFLTYKSIKTKSWLIVGSIIPRVLVLWFYISELGPGGRPLDFITSDGLVVILLADTITNIFELAISNKMLLDITQKVRRWLRYGR